MACSMYVDLNPVRAAMADSPDHSPHTSAFDRIEGEKGETIDAAAFDLKPVPREQVAKEIRETPVNELRQKHRRRKRNPTGRKVRRDSWLSPLTMLPGVLSKDAQVHGDGLRASDRGFLTVPWEEYLELLRWTAKQSVDGIVAKVPKALQPTLTQIGIDASMWRDLVWNWQKYFGKTMCAGKPDSMKADAEARGKPYHRGQASVASCFS